MSTEKNTGELEFNLELESVPFKVRAKDGTINTYTIREMTGRERDAYLNALTPKIKVNSAGEQIGFRDHKGFQAGLLARCVYDSTGELVPEEVIQTWSGRMQTDLFKIAVRLSGLGDGGDGDKEGND